MTYRMYESQNIQCWGRANKAKIMLETSRFCPVYQKLGIILLQRGKKVVTAQNQEF